jgi:hypothetical protein
MLTFIWIGAVFVLAIVALLAYSSRNKKAPPEPIRGDDRTVPLTNTDVQMNPDKKRATGVGED